MSKSKIPLPVKLGYTAFMAVLVPYYWMEYGPTNFIYFCDIALFLTLVTVWTEKPLAASMAGVGIVLPQVFWQLDFLASIGGWRFTGMTDYMFNPEISWMARGLSFFHFWLPILIVYLIWKLGYHRRAWLGWTLTAWAAILVSYYLLPAPGDTLAFPNQPHNVNYVFGISGDASQTWMSPTAWLMLLLVGLPTLIYAPTHWVLAKCFADHSGSADAKHSQRTLGLVDLELKPAQEA